MGNKLAGSPFPTYDVAVSRYSAAELAEAREKFALLSGGQNTVNLASVVQKVSPMSAYVHRQICPRIFSVLDIKRDSVIDFEEYLCALTVFRSNSLEDKAKCVFMMYEGSKSGGSMTKDNLRQMVVDSGMCGQKNDVPLATLEQWMADMKGLSQAAAEAAFIQYAAHSNKMELQEFLQFAKNDPSVKAFMPVITAILE